MLFLNIKKITILPICQGENLVSSKKIILLKGGYHTI